MENEVFTRWNLSWALRNGKCLCRQRREVRTDQVCRYKLKRGGKESRREEVNMEKQGNERQIKCQAVRWFQGSVECR